MLRKCQVTSLQEKKNDRNISVSVSEGVSGKRCLFQYSIIQWTLEPVMFRTRCTFAPMLFKWYTVPYQGLVSDVCTSSEEW